MRIINLIKCEFIKNYNLKNLLIIIITLLISVIAISSLWFLFYEGLDDFESSFNNGIIYSQEKYQSYEALDDSFEKEFYLNYYQKRIEMLEKKKTIDNYFQECFQDIVLSTHHAYMHTFSNSTSVKIIENQNGIAMVQHYNGQ